MKFKKTVLILIVIFTLLALTACGSSSNTNTNTNTSSSSSSVKVTDAHMTTNVDSDGKPLDTVTSYKTSAERFTVSAIIRNAPNNTKITFVWFYDGDEVTSVDLDSGTIADRYIFGYLTNTQAWPEGEYSVEIYIEDNSSPANVVNFTVGK